MDIAERETDAARADDTRDHQPERRPERGCRQAIQTNVNYLIEHGIVTGQGVLLAVGAGGDFSMLTLEERKLAAKAIVDAADGRVPVIWARRTRMWT